MESQGIWDQATNELYKFCFGVDVLEICDEGPEAKPIVPKYEPWVRMKVLENVKMQEVMKFRFIGGQDDGV